MKLKGLNLIALTLLGVTSYSSISLAAPNITLMYNSPRVHLKVGEPISIRLSTAPNASRVAFTNCMITPSLPTGLHLNASNCEISGTPLEPSSHQVEYTVAATASSTSGCTFNNKPCSLGGTLSITEISSTPTVISTSPTHSHAPSSVTGLPPRDGLSAPTSLGATHTHNSVSLSWTAPPSKGTHDSYIVRRSRTSGGPYSNVGSVNSASFTDNSTNNPNSPPVSNTTYYYVVAAINTFGTSPNSSQISVTTNAAPVDSSSGHSSMGHNTGTNHHGNH